MERLWNDALSLSLAEWRDVMAELGEPPFRAGQVFAWIHKEQVTDYASMTNLSKDLREKLTRTVPLHLPSIALTQTSADGQTRKYLVSLYDQEQIETVQMRYRYGDSLCISSQVGCRMGCRFCASTLSGRKRDLTPGEMLGQVYAAQRAGGTTVSHVDIMGCGEPLDNYQSLLRFLSLIHDAQGKNLSYRNITVSTCGLTEGIRALAREDLPITLAISLHAPNDEIRRSMMPIAARVSMDELLATCRDYADATRRRITYEYALVGGVNDAPEHAKELAARLAGTLCHVNLIPVNPIKERAYQASSKDSIRKFMEILEQHGIEVTLRREMGREIDAACGQLRRNHEKGEAV